MANSSRPLPLNALRAFEAVARHQHVAHAATELCVTPSAVSHLIKKLESDLGVALITRAGRNIELTEHGRKLAPLLKENFQGISKAVNSLRKDRFTHSVTLALRSYFSAQWFGPRLNDFWSKHPGIELRLKHTNEIPDLKADDLDLAIVWGPIESLATKAQLLLPGELVPIFSPGMGGAERIKSPGDLLHCTLLMETDGNSWGDWFRQSTGWDQVLQHQHFIDDSNVRYQAAIDGVGVELCCRQLIQHELDSGRLVAPFDTALTSHGYFLLEPDNSASTDSAECLKQWILEQVSQLQA